MRVWDIHPGYLNRQSLLGEHRELHGIVAIISQGKKGYANHPETRRWQSYGWALQQRHRLLACEMALRGFTDRSPVALTGSEGNWPAVYLDEPAAQYRLLGQKYQHKEQGRIPLPRNSQQLWAQHKYSVLARDPGLYQKIGASLARPGNRGFAPLARLLAETLRLPPSPGGIGNAAQHLWGYVSGPDCGGKPPELASWSPAELLRETQQRTMANQVTYLLHSTALSDLAAWPDSP
ncbi:DUF1722 domain-containing protein [Desulfurivibrio alkaliphilus]|uniref:DUF1722 domain-containing protein n=1 Tax=Desulfurivibrio alkaliphilus (strain DSM 19089 / UNIQEM U267 / AHT2) TaxID=589865 RepID=D6Z023_DESAT|nr:DUF1722 domain-containing protein [Desulfurivibrio alkaliphilus]ADH87056.1 conserved hypothetical protein [Desulfurivibrio alkaliphilus AHT 2]